MQTALHIYALVRELKDRIIGSTMSGSEFYKKERGAYILFKTKEETLALGFAYHPVGFGAFLLPRGKVEIKTDEKPWPFFQAVNNGVVKAIHQFGLDRIFRIDIEKEDKSFGVIIEAIGPNGNIWLVGPKDIIIATLRHKKYQPSDSYIPPASLDKLNPLLMTFDEFRAALISDISLTLEQFLRKNIGGFDEFMTDDIITRLGLRRDSNAAETHESTMAELHQEIVNSVSRFNEYHPGYLYSLPGGRRAYPFKLNTAEADFQKFKSLSLAVYTAMRDNRETKVEFSDKQKVLDTAARHVQKLEKKVINIEQDLAGADRSECYKKYAELLKINLSSIKRGMKTIELHDIYGTNGGKIKIPLNPALNASENADEYFKKYRKGKDSLTLLERRLEIARKELTAARELLSDLENDYDRASQKYAAEIMELLPKEAARREIAPRLPYRPHTLSTGVTIFIGRDGIDNDTTTFGHAKPYELWFHAAQCPGSHVVLKFPDKNFKPSKNEIAETAAVAAYHSKARNSKTVPVIYTERRYVRKPRNAKPGLVTVEREKMVMVEPKKSE